MLKVGKRNFIFKTSRYLKKVESSGEEIIITHQNRPTLKIVPIHPKTVADLRGVIKKIAFREDVNKPVFQSLDKW